jgi:seryl-tRNA synthetase
MSFVYSSWGVSVNRWLQQIRHTVQNLKGLPKILQVLRKCFKEFQNLLQIAMSF